MQMRHLQHGHKTYGFFNLFGGDKSAGADDQYSEVETGPDRDWSNQGVDEVVITTWTDDSGKEYDIVYRNGGLVDAASVEILCDKIQWPRRPQEKLDAALKNSFLVSSITLEERGCPPEKRRLIGSARCTSDGAFNATIWDVMVDPEFQGLGLGKALLELMVRSLLQREISNITLFADSQVVSFYKKLGFDVDPEGIKGMFFRFGL
jgi:ribosomal protein S18 acetylase RimI-like enzyme